MKNYLTLCATLFTLSLSAQFDLCDPDDVFFDQLTTYTTYADYIVSDDNCYDCTNSIVSQQVADNFLLAADGEINKICWIGGFDEFPTISNQSRNDNNSRGDACQSSELEVTITYYSDISGSPGSVLAAHTLVPDFEEIGGIGPHPVCLFTASHPTLSVSGNTPYWVSLTSNEGGECDFYLIYSPNTQNAKRDVNSRNLQDGFIIKQNNGNWMPFNGAGNAASLFLIGFEAVQPIPTIGQWGLTILCLLFLVVGIIYNRNNILSRA